MRNPLIPLNPFPNGLRAAEEHSFQPLTLKADQNHHYEWTKSTIEDPVKKAKYLGSFTLCIGGNEVYSKEEACALASDLQPLVGGLITRMSKYDANPANNPPPPARLCRKAAGAGRSADGFAPILQ